jgi:hypothetical protein
MQSPPYVVVKSEEPDLQVDSTAQKLQPAIATAKAVRPLYSIEKISESLGLNRDHNYQRLDRWNGHLEY